jgi:site-specific DNA-methyltransferase (adenine-specific)
MNREYHIINEDARTALRRFQGRADLIVTSPPYADARKRHYDSIDPDEYAAWFASFHEPLAAALKPEGSLVINIKDKIVDGVRHRYVWDTIKTLEGLGWYAIDDYLWHKPNAMPGFWPTRLRDAWEYCFHMSRSKRPHIDFEAVKRPIGEWAGSRLARLGPNDTSRQNSANASGFGRNISRWADRKTVLPDNVLSLPLVGKNKGHPAVFPVELPAFFIRLLTPKDGLVIDPFAGSGTTAIAAFQEGRSCVLIDNNRKYCKQAAERLRSECGLIVPHLTPTVSNRGKQVRAQSRSTISRVDVHQLAA